MQSNNCVLNKILKNFGILRSYCDTFWNTTYQNYSTHIKCKYGCAGCCILQSVNLLESYYITLHLRNNKPIKNIPENSSGCAFLIDECCSIYPVRPLLCRTHGLLLKSDDFEEKIRPSCYLNFTDTTLQISQEHILDTDVITMNATKLNCAFALCLGDISLASLRITMHALATQNYPDIFNTLLD